MLAVGNQHTGSAFDEGMWAPSAPLEIATAALASRLASSNGAATGPGVGEAQQAIRRD
jgi:hypothetical protein